MTTFIEILGSGFTAFFSYKAYVILPAFMLILAFAARMKASDALRSAIQIGAGFAGIFVVFTFFVSQISPAIDSIIKVRGLDYPVLDIGWPPLAAITWSASLTPLAIALAMLVNLAMLATRMTRNLYVDLWNYWHFAFLGVMIQGATGSVFLGIASVVLITVYTIKCAEWSAPHVLRETGLDGIAVSPLSVAGLLPYAVCVDWLFDRVPGLRRLSWNPSRKRNIGGDASGSASGGSASGGSADAANANGESSREKTAAIPAAESLLGEPMVIGFLVGAFLAFLAGYGIRELLEMAVNIAAVMFLLPRCGGLIGEGMGAVSRAVKELVERKFPSFTGLSIAMDTGFLMTNPSVIATGLILMPISLALAFILPGNRVIPVGDLPNLISIMSLTVLILRGNVIRAVLAALPVLATFLWFSSSLSPVFTREALKAGMDVGASGREITAFTDGGNQLRFWLYHLFQGNPYAIAALPLAAALVFFAWKAHRASMRKAV